MAVETDTNIVKAIRPGQVPREVYSYLSPRQAGQLLTSTQKGRARNGEG